jgi:uncharacterized phage-associated protein
MTASAHDIAAELRERLPGVGQKKLHKLLYYCQGQHLATFGRPLFAEQIYAWDMGPVVATLWREEHYHEPRPEPHALDEGELNTIGQVVSQFGALTGEQLERLTHSEHPWRAGYERRQLGDSDRIELSWIRAYFVSVSADDQDDDDRAGGDVVRAWLASTEPSPEPPAAKPDSREALLSRLRRG